MNRWYLTSPQNKKRATTKVLQSPPSKLVITSETKNWTSMAFTVTLAVLSQLSVLCTVSNQSILNLRLFSVESLRYYQCTVNLPNVLKVYWEFENRTLFYGRCHLVSITFFGCESVFNETKPKALPYEKWKDSYIKELFQTSLPKFLIPCKSNSSK